MLMRQTDVNDFLYRLTIEDGTYMLSRNVGNYQHTLRNIPEERSPQLRRVGSLDSRKYVFYLCCFKSFKNLESRNLYQDCSSKYGSIHFTKYVIDTNLIEVYLSVYLALRINYIENSGYICLC
jgi:hypothetical protein